MVIADTKKQKQIKKVQIPRFIIFLLCINTLLR